MPVDDLMAVIGPEHGNHGQYLRIDLSIGRSEFTPLANSISRKFLGGCGLGTYLLLSEKTADIAPLAAEAAIVFAFGPLVDTDISASARFAVVSRSPLTERINDSLAAGEFAVAGKRSGVDALVLTGRAKEPSIILIDNGQVCIESAIDLWGMTCGEVQGRIRKRLGDQYETVVIGPAGERAVRFASIAHGSHYAGRGGSGAVLGSKNIKAIAIRGNQCLGPARPRQLAAIVESIRARSMGSATEKYRELGTVSNLLVFNRLHALPNRNFQRASVESRLGESLEALANLPDLVRQSCPGCKVACERFYNQRHGKKSKDSGNGELSGVRLTYENSFALGPLCGIYDPQIVREATRLCNQLGMDTISTGGTVAFAMECVERSLLDVPWLRFGDGGALFRVINDIGHLRGVGRMLAKGSRGMAEELGQDSIALAAQVKGLEIPGYEPRAMQAMALGFAVNARGADHNRSGAYDVDFSTRSDRRDPAPETVSFAIETENRAALSDSLILCKFLRNIFDDIYQEASDILNSVVGWETTGDELRQTAKRIVAAKKLFNIRAGWRPEEDILPERFLDSPLPDDHGASLPAARLAKMVAAYNSGRGWSSEGWIGPEQLDNLGLSDL